MSGQHTPGPWVAMLKPRASMSDHGWRAMAMCGDKWMVGARYEQAVTVQDGIVTSGWNNEANARLIAAAPELLEALKAAKRHLVVDSMAWEMADTVISKATASTTDAGVAG